MRVRVSGKRFQRSLEATGLVILTLPLCFVGVSAQTTPSQITGTVTDAKGLAMSGVSVTG